MSLSLARCHFATNAFDDNFQPLHLDQDRAGTTIMELRGIETESALIVEGLHKPLSAKILQILTTWQRRMQEKVGRKRGGGGERWGKS